MDKEFIGMRGQESIESAPHIDIVQELESSPQGQAVADFLRGSVSLGLQEQLRREAPKMIHDLEERGVLTLQTGDAILRLLFESAESYGSKNSYWLSEETASGYIEGARADDQTLALFLENIKSITSHLQPGDSVLDVGTGIGYTAQGILNSLPNGKNIQLYGIDISPAMVQKNALRDKYQEIVIGDMQHGLPKQYQKLRPKLITAIGVFPCFSPEGMRTAFSNISSILPEDGTFYFNVTILPIDTHPRDASVPMYEYVHPLQQPVREQVGLADPKTMYHYYNAAWIQQLLSEFGLEVIESKDTFMSKGSVEHPARLFVVQKRRSKDV